MSKSISRNLIAFLLLCVLVQGSHAQAFQVPAESSRFAVIGDCPSGTSEQDEVASPIGTVRSDSRYARIYAGDQRRRTLVPVRVRRPVRNAESATPRMCQLQRGITYFGCGPSGKLRRGDLSAFSWQAAAWIGQDLAFTMVEIIDDVTRFQAISRMIVVVHSGVILRVALR